MSETNTCVSPSSSEAALEGKRDPARRIAQERLLLYVRACGFPPETSLELALTALRRARRPCIPGGEEDPAAVAMSELIDLVFTSRRSSLNSGRDDGSEAVPLFFPGIEAGPALQRGCMGRYLNGGKTWLARLFCWLRHVASDGRRSEEKTSR